ncbi:4a-hydroxytetrahydrobiopterin dehydratase [bacterium]|nr:MAG: 4a-hydroxytetrahydrobiopterin dehydratase [bacterium]
MAPGLLNEDKILSQLEQLKGWSRDGKEIRRLIEFADFVRAMAFVNSVALLAEKSNHHPDIDIRWNKVRLALSTHSAGGLTELDFKLAKAIDEL